MNISARSYLTAGVSLTTAAAIAFTPVAVPPPIPAPAVAAPQVALTANPAIGVVDTIVTTIDTVFTQLSTATNDPTAAASLEILRGLSVRAFAMLAANLRRGDAVNAATTAQVTDLLTSALTRPPTGGVAGTRMLVGLGLDAIQAVGDAGFALAGIAVDEVTFQANNGLGGLSTLLTQLGDASGSPLVEAVVTVVQSLTFAPVLAVVNAGSQAAGAALGAGHAGFDAVLDGAGAVVGAPKQRVEATALRDETRDDEASDLTVTALRDERPADDTAAETPVDAKRVDDDPVAEEAVDAKALDDDPADKTDTEVTDVRADESAAEPKESAHQPDSTADSTKETAEDAAKETAASAPDTADAAA